MSEGLRDWFDGAMDQPLRRREAWVRTQVPESMQERLLLLLAACEHAHPEPQSERLPAWLFEGDEAEVGWQPQSLIGTHIGGFRLLSLIGTGGMSCVFAATREQADFDQRVALKLLRNGIYTALEQTLFRRERKILAGLSHPNIARMIDGGVTEQGIPYLVMELVEGESITQYCRSRNSPLQQRLQLFQVLCVAVDAAHRRFVVHRDLKPANVLVAADGTLKLIDFGIAKLIDPEDAATRTIGSLLTPEYAAPEQFVGGHILPATDVYALGVILHELLLDERPSRGQMARPSQRLLRPGFEPGYIARRHLHRQMLGDLDNVLLKALDAESALRYRDAGDFADDIARFLDGRAVRAHPPSRWYRARKFLVRYRGAVTVTAGLVLAVFASLGIALWQARDAQRQSRLALAHAANAEASARQAKMEKEHAEQALLIATEIQQFTLRMFDSAFPDVPEAQEPSVRDLVLSAQRDLERNLARSPQVSVALHLLLISLHEALGNPDEVRALSDHAWKLAEAKLQPQDEGFRAALFAYANARNESGQADGLGLMRQAVQMAPEESESVDDADRLLTLATALARIGPSEESLAVTGKAEAALRRRCEREGETAVCRMHTIALNNLGNVYFSLRQFEPGYTHLRRAYEQSQRVYGADHRETAKTQGNLGLLAMYLDKHEEALEHTQAAIAQLMKIEGPQGDSADYFRQTHALLLGYAGRPLEAIAVHIGVLERQRNLDPKSLSAQIFRLNFARDLITAGRYVQAQEQLDAIAPHIAGSGERVHARLLETQAHLWLEHDRDSARAQIAIDRALALREANRDTELVNTLIIAYRIYSARMDANAPATAHRIDSLIDEITAVPAVFRRHWTQRQLEQAINQNRHADAAQLLTTLRDAAACPRRSASCDWAEVFAAQLAQRGGRDPGLRPAWVAELKARFGAQAPIVRASQALLPPGT